MEMRLGVDRKQALVAKVTVDQTVKQRLCPRSVEPLERF